MFDREHWREIWQVLRRNRLRTFLTAFGVFWGIFMLVILLASGNGLENGVTRGFSDQATNSFFVWTRVTSKPYRGLPAGREPRLTNADTEAIRRLPEVGVVAPRNQIGGYRGGNNVSRGAKTGAFSVMGDYPEFRETKFVRVTRGRFLNPLDIADRRKVAVVGTRVVDLLFDEGEEPLGGSIRINGVYFKVVGVFAPTADGEDAAEEAQSIHVPFSTFQQAFNFGDRVGWYAINSAAGVPASATEQKVLALLRNRHTVHPEDERAFGHFNLEEEYEQVQGLFFSIRLLVWIVGIGTIAAGAIGVSNIMLVIVRERTPEIGVRRAVGATPRAIVGHVMLEALVLTALAGYLGMVLGIGVIEAFNHFLRDVDMGMFRQPDVGLRTVLQALAILGTAGLLAGLIPARRAVKLRPVEALRAIV